MNSTNDPKFFLDRNLGRRIVPAALRRAGFVVEVQDERFAQDTRDEIWLEAAGAEGWYVITLDQKIRYRQLEQEAVRTHGVGLFVLVGWRNSTAEGWAEAVVKAKAAMFRFLGTNSRPFIAKIYRDGRVQLWLGFGKQRRRPRR